MKSFVAFISIVVLVTLGCSKGDGLTRYTLSGTAKLANDKPIPVGEITLEPDGAEGNQGPSSVAQIRDGAYSLSEDQGVIGGKYVATIIAFDGVAFGESAQGKPLIKAPYVEKLDLPKEDSTRDFKLK